MTKMTGAEVIVKALKEHGVDHIFGYPWWSSFAII